MIILVSGCASLLGLGDEEANGDASPECPADWWDCDFSHRAVLTFKNTGTQTLSDFPVLIQFSEGDEVYQHIRTDGADIRFTTHDATRGADSLDYEVERWQHNGDSVLWVKVPEIDQQAGADHIVLYYGNAEAVALDSASDVWSDAFAGVYHFADTAAIYNSTSEEQTGQVIDDPLTSETGQIGDAIRFNGNSSIDLLATAGAMDLVNGEARTFEAWFKMPMYMGVPPDNRAMIFNKAANCRGWTTYVASNGNLQALFAAKEDMTTPCEPGAQYIVPTKSNPSGRFDDDQWYYAVVIADRRSSPDEICIYGLWWDDSDMMIKGGQPGCETIMFSSNSISANNNNALLGETGDKMDRDRYIGALDELRVSSTRRSEAWIHAQLASMSDQFIDVGASESWLEPAP